jgi:uncharacterized protein Yka (UPF0111/DUF47 family)
MRLLPRDEQFFQLFGEIATRAVDTSRHLGELFGTDGERTAYLIEAIGRIEREADHLTHEVLTRLDSSFITPLDREDIHLLAQSLDDVIDRMDGIARRTRIFRVGIAPRGAVLMSNVIHRATLQIHEAVRELGLERNEAVLAACREVRRLEEEGDALYHEWMATLFDGTPDPLTVMKWKELYDKLEDTLDSTESVANTLESVAIKHG